MDNISFTMNKQGEELEGAVFKAVKLSFSVKRFEIMQSTMKISKCSQCRGVGLERCQHW